MAAAQSSVLVKVLEGDLETDNRQTHLNALKMNCYLLCEFSQKFEGVVTKSVNAIAVAGPRVGILNFFKVIDLFCVY